MAGGARCGGYCPPVGSGRRALVVVLRTGCGWRGTEAGGLLCALRCWAACVPAGVVWGWGSVRTGLLGLSPTTQLPCPVQDGRWRRRRR